MDQHFRSSKAMDSEQRDPAKIPSVRDNGEASNEETEGAVGLPLTASSLAGPREENPFSFRHFLRRSQNVNGPIQQDPQRVVAEEQEASRFGGARPKTTARNARAATESDMKSPCGLPDFVQDYLGVEHEAGPTTVGHLDDYIPGVHSYRNTQGSVNDPLDLPRSHSPIHAAGAMPIPLDIANLATVPVADDMAGRLDLANLNASSHHSDVHQEPQVPIPNGLEANEINNNENMNSLSQLPDFLSDGPMHSGRMNQEPPLEPSPSNQIIPSNPSIMEENNRLRQQLEITTANERAAMARIERLEALLEEFRRRETEETSTLEKSMEQVENNLRLATQRAVQFESQVSQLKKDNRKLQEEIKALQDALRCQSRQTSEQQPRNFSDTAQELHSAADNAERSIRELLAGVERLRVVAASIECMEKIEEVRQKRDRDK